MHNPVPPLSTTLLRARRVSLAAFIAVGLVSCKNTTAVQVQLSVLPETIPQLEVGQSIQLTLQGAIGPIVWTSSDETVAVVLATGFVTAVGPGQATITGENEGQSVSVVVNVQERPRIELTVSSVSLTAGEGARDPAPVTVDIVNGGGGTLSGLSFGPIAYQGSASDWLVGQLSSTVAAPLATLTLQALTAGLPVGDHTATVPVTSTSSENPIANVQVSISIVPPAAITLSAADVELAATVGEADPPPAPVTVTNGGVATLADLSVEVTYPPGGATGWLTAELSGPADEGRTVDPSSTITLTAAKGILAPGDYPATVRVSSPDDPLSPVELPVLLTIWQTPVVDFSDPSVAFAAEPGSSPQLREVTVVNGVPGPMGGLAIQSVVYAPGQPTGWLTAGPLGSTTAPAALPLQADPAGLAIGSYDATVRVSSTQTGVGAADLPVQLDVQPGPAISLSVSALAFTAPAGGGAAPGQAVTITNTGGGVLTGLATDVRYGAGQPGGWLSAVLTATTAAPAATLTLQPSPATLGVGDYTADVEVISPVAGNSPQVVTVSFEVVQPPVIALSANPYVFANVPFGGPDPAPAQVDVTNGGGFVLDGLAMGAIQYGAGEPGGWLTAVLQGSSAPTTVELTASVAGLQIGTYTATVPLTGDEAAPVDLVVTLEVVDPPVIVTSVDDMSFEATKGGGNPAGQVVTVTNGGGGSLGNVTTQVFYVGFAGWLTVSPIGNDQFVVRPTTGSLGADTYQATIRFKSDVEGVPFKNVTVEFDVLVSWAGDIWPLFGPTPGYNCGGCHPPAGNASLDLTSQSNAYTSLVGAGGGGTVYVTPGNDAVGRLVSEVAPTGSHGGPKLSSAQFELLKQWIREGARNN